jgi:hypothetical protein
VQQALEESGIGTIQEIKDFYVNDIIAYYRQTYKKVAKLYEEHKAKRHAEMTEAKKSNSSELFGPNSIHSSVYTVGSARNDNNEDFSFIKTEQDAAMEEFMNENDL